MSKQHKRSPQGWDSLAAWYDGWMGQHGSRHHRQLALPAVLDLLQPDTDEAILDVGAGQGVLAPSIAACGARYTGIEISPRLIGRARQRHGQHGTFLRGDARRLHTISKLAPESFDGVVFLLSIQDMNPLEEVLRSAAWALRAGGRLVILMTHPCFRIPRQSGWGRDPQRKLLYRRVDCYLTPLQVPLKPYGKQQRGISISFHRPLNQYINTLGKCGLLVDQLDEISGQEIDGSKAENRAAREFPLFLGIRARKFAVL
ncbi:MAG: class I SAM-dependent methyltransferase [Chloroflexi bacterium]|nr:class I SAM-dependent methyltransferase [Chloroflexota bacterium]